MSQCETYWPKKDFSFISPAHNGECKREATRKVFLKSGKILRLCGYCARDWKRAALKIEVITN